MFDHITYVKQPTYYGCAIACLAMVLGYTYDEMEAWLEAAGWTAEKRTNGTSDFVYREVLHRHDLSVMQIFKYDSLAGRVRSPWPPEPFAPIHIVCVELENFYHHAIVLLENGDVLDPDSTERTDLHDPFYKDVIHITGIFSALKGA